MIAAIGARNIHNRNTIPVTSAVSPVRPPASTPDADSMNVVTVEVPVTEPQIVPIASEVRASYPYHQPYLLLKPYLQEYL